MDIADKFYNWEREIVIGNNSNGFRLATMEEALRYGRNVVDFEQNAVFACED